MRKKSKKAKKKPKRVLTTGEILRQAKKEKRRKRILVLFMFIVILISIVVASWYVMSGQPRGILIIHVIDEHTNNPISGATITISGPYEATVQAEEQGMYRFESIPAGTYTVTVSKEGYHVHPETASVEAGQTTDHTVRLHTHH